MEINKLVNLKESQDMRLAFYQLEKEYRPYFDLFVENQDKYKEFGGGVTLNGYLNYQPDILLLAYNPAHGLHREWRYKNSHLVNWVKDLLVFLKDGMHVRMLNGGRHQRRNVILSRQTSLNFYLVMKKH